MRVLLEKFLVVVAFLVGTFYSIAGNPSGPPAPSPTGKPGPTPPGFPIDENSMVLVVVAILFGIYIIYKDTLKAKASK